MATFLDPTFKHFKFIPRLTPEDVRFKRDLTSDLDDWILTEMNDVAQKLSDFSSVGHTITDARSRLSASKVEAIEITETINVR